MNEKQKNILIIVLAVIIVILLCIVSWILGAKFANVEEEILDNNKQEENINEIANDLFSRITDLYMCGEPELDLGVDNKLTYNELDENYINRMVVGSLFLNKKYETIEDSKYQISAEDFKNEFINLFGDKVPFKLPRTVYISYIKFDLVGDNYIGSTMAMGCENIFGEYYLADYKKEEDKFSLYVYLLYSFGEDKYVVNNNINLPLEESIQTYTKEEILNNYKSELTKYKYTFNIENDNYIFESIELVN